MREIVTLQLGHLSNNVATHFWNTQESYFTYSENEKPLVDHDVHWRAGYGTDGSETFLPRTVIYDLKGGFGSLRKINALYDVDPDADATASSLWPGQSVVHKQARLEPSAYQQSLDAGTEPPKLTTSTVRYWSDFSRVYYHPKSLNQLYDYELHSSIQPFERFEMGNELFGALDKDQDIVDRDWRPFVEECDQMQGIQVFTTIDDAWGGFASSYIEALRDEYPKQCIWVWGLQNPALNTPLEKRRLRLTNSAHSTSQISAQATTFVPLSMPGTLPSSVSLEPSSAWHTSALLAAAAESATLPSRLYPLSDAQRVSLGDLSQILNTNGSQALAGLRMGVGAQGGADNEDKLDVDFLQLGRMKGDKLDKSSHLFGKAILSRGQDEEEDESEQGRDERGRMAIGDPVVRRFNTQLQFPMLNSYPQIYPSVSGQPSVPLHTALFTDQSISQRMKNLKSQVTWGVGLEEREVLSNSLSEIAEAYHDDWSSGSDDNDDD